MIEGSAGLPGAVRDAPSEAAAPEAVSLRDGERALMSAVRERLVGNDKTQRTVEMVASEGEMAEAVGRQTDLVENNDTMTDLDELGLTLRVPVMKQSVNQQPVVGVCACHRAFLRSIAEAETAYDVTLPDEERMRRALAYAGAELVVQRLVEGRDVKTDERSNEETGEDAEADTGEDQSEAAGDEDGAGRLEAVREEYGLAADTDLKDVAESLDRVARSGAVGALAAGVDVDEADINDMVRDLRAALNHQRYLAREEGEETDPGDDGDDQYQPAPEDGVLGYDWVSTADRSWSGRPIRALLYALLTESDGLALPDEAVDRVELVNYGTPTVDGHEDFPPGERFTTLWSHRRPGVPAEDVKQHALDVRVVGDFFGLSREHEETVKDALKQHVNAVHIMGRYEPSMREHPLGEPLPDDGDGEREADGEAGATDPEQASAIDAAASVSETGGKRDEDPDLAANGVGDDGLSDAADRAKERLDMELPFERVPLGLVESMDDVKSDQQDDYNGPEVDCTQDEAIHLTSRSTQT